MTHFCTWYFGLFWHLRSVPSTSGARLAANASRWTRALQQSPWRCDCWKMRIRVAHGQSDSHAYIWYTWWLYPDWFDSGFNFLISPSQRNRTCYPWHSGILPSCPPALFPFVFFSSQPGLGASSSSGSLRKTQVSIFKQIIEVFYRTYHELIVIFLFVQTFTSVQVGVTNHQSILLHRWMLLHRRS